MNAELPRNNAARRAPEIIVAGHICLDVIPQIQSSATFRPGALVEAGPASISTGGAVANTGLALHRLGVPVSLMGKIGGDLFGRAIRDILASHDPSLSEGMIVDPRVATSYSIVISPPGLDRMFFHCPGANDSFTADDVRYADLHGAKLFHFGYPPIMKQMFRESGNQLLRMFTSVRQAGLATSLDMALPDPQSEAGSANWAAILERILPLVDLFLPSIDELLYMLDRPVFHRLSLNGSESVITAPLVQNLAQRLLNMGTAVAAIKLGEIGLYVQTTSDEKRLSEFCGPLNLDPQLWHNRRVYTPCFSVKFVGSTGSGDSTIAGFLAALLRGCNPHESAIAAAAVGACSVEAADATSGIPPWPKIQARLTGGWPRVASKIPWPE